MARSRPLNGWALSLEGRADRHLRLGVTARPSRGTYEPVIGALHVRDRRLTIAADRPTRLAPFGFEAQAHAEAAIIRFDGMTDPARWMSRFVLQSDIEKPIGRSRFISRSFAAWTAGGRNVPAQNLIFLGGPITAPGYEFHQFTGRAGASQRVELQFPVPFISLPLGRYGRTPASVTLAPFANAAWINHPREIRGRMGNSGWGVPGVQERQGWHPSVGVGALALFDLLRFDVARGLRDGRWTFHVDVSRDFWGIL
jgi:hypothetical protein